MPTPYISLCIQYDQHTGSMQLQLIWIIYSNFLTCCSVYESVNDLSHCFPPPFSGYLCFATCYLVSELQVCRTCFSSSLVWKDKKEWVGRGWCGCLGGIFGTLPHFVFINNNFPYLLLSFQAHSSRTTIILLYFKKRRSSFGGTDNRICEFKCVWA